MRKGFSLIEMLVVIGIITILIGASIGGYAKMTKSAERAKVQELVSNAATALTAYFQAEGVWPRRLRSGDGRLDADHALVLAKGGHFSLTTDNTSDPKSATKLVGLDRFGIVTPWAQAVIRRLGTAATLASPVSGKATVQDHILYYALDLDGDGVISGNELRNISGIEQIRATAAVWCCGKDGQIQESYQLGLKRGNVYSWTKGQTQK